MPASARRPRAAYLGDLAPYDNGAAEAVNTVTVSGTTQTLPDTSTATLNHITLTANCTVTLPPAGAGKSLTVVLKQDGTGGRTVTWPASVKWPAGVAPSLSPGAGAVDIVSLLSTDGSTWYALLAGNAFA